MVSRYLTLVKAAPFVLLLSFITLGLPGLSQLHHVLVEPSNAVYSSTCDISDGSQHSLTASTIANGSPENHVRISRVKTNGSLQWENDYFTGNGWRASHVLTVNDEVGVLIGAGGLDTIGTPVHSLVMTFDLTTGASIALVEIEENNATAAKGLVLTHGIFCPRPTHPDRLVGGGNRNTACRIKGVRSHGNRPSRRRSIFCRPELDSCFEHQWAAGRR